MGRQPCCDKVGLKKGPWTAEEDKKLINFILTNGQCCWRAVPKLAGLLRCGKSCRLRWTNYLRPDLKRGLLSEYEEKMVIDLHAQLGNRWSKIASHLPGRTDNEIKNLWNTHIKKKLRKMGIDPLTHKQLPTTETSSPPPPPPQENQEQENQEQEVQEQSKEANTEENKMACTLFDPMELIINSDNDNDNNINNGFCIEEVPLIEAHEILVPSSSSSTTTTTPSSSSISSPSSCYGSNNNNFLEDLQFSEFEWPNNEMELWNDDLISSCWDLLINDVDNDIDRKQQVEAAAAAIDDDPPFNQCPRMILDQDSWTYYGIL